MLVTGYCKKTIKIEVLILLICQFYGVFWGLLSLASAPEVMEFESLLMKEIGDKCEVSSYSITDKFEELHTLITTYKRWCLMFDFESVIFGICCCDMKYNLPMKRINQNFWKVGVGDACVFMFIKQEGEFVAEDKAYLKVLYHKEKRDQKEIIDVYFTNSFVK